MIANGAMRDNFTPYILVMLTGLVSSVFIGLIAWYNSKRPPGWEDAQRPSYIPKLDMDQPTAPESNAQSQGEQQPESSPSES
ncbi:MAG: hypothetical protein RML75_18065 [Cyanobacteriota bacterium SKYGB_h_bin112]|nr:hypothetical protein [Cyanobacteriota bacterium SKYGB_h_bin112]